MGRRCECRALMDMLRDDPRLRLVPLGARMLWLLLADALPRMALPGVFRIGARVGSNREVSLLVSADETETETHLETLIETGLLRRLDDGALALPDLAEASHATAARRNGAVGGRPRRGETAEQARVRRSQGNLMMPIAGGRAETQGTQREKPSRAGLATACLDKAIPKQAADAGVVSLGSDLAEIAGLDPARGTYDFRPVMTWLSAGIPADLIRDTVRRVAARPSYRAPMRGLGYFDPAVREAHAGQGARPVVTAAADGPRMDYTKFLAELEVYTANGCLGEAPVMRALAA